jgi:hypothetical protein
MEITPVGEQETDTQASKPNKESKYRANTPAEERGAERER